MEIIILYTLVVILCITQLIDLYTTVKILEKGGKELNPILSWMFEKIGILPTLIIVKAIVIGLIIFFYREIAVIGVALLDALYIYVCANNIKELKKG